jgi:hypothetical protein
MSSCPGNLDFSPTHAEKRQEKARELLGEAVLNRILAFALFLLGGKREQIAQYLGVPLGTLLSFLTRINAIGLQALEDRRVSPEKKQPKVAKLPSCNVNVTEQNICIQFGSAEPLLEIPSANQLQAKTVLLTFLNHGLLSTNEAAEALGLSSRRVRDLNARMHENDVGALIDKRRGQLEEYRFTPEIKSELVQQFAVNAISGQSTSSRALAENLQQRCSLIVSDRSIRLQLQKLGLRRIANTLPELVAVLKKTPDDKP